MSTLTIILTLSLFADSAQTRYEEKDVHALERLCRDQTSLEASFLCRYRLFPLTQQEKYISSIPDDVESQSARTLALLSGLWGYRAARASWLSAITYGRRSAQLMKKATVMDPDEPFVLLISGQSLLFRPAIAGGDKRAALDKFKRLKEVTHLNPEAGVSTWEAESWIWYALDKLGATGADAYRNELLSRRPPRLIQEFLQDPP